MGHFKKRLIVPPRSIMMSKKRGVNTRQVYRYAEGKWTPSDGKLPDLAFVVIDNGFPVAYGAKFRDWELYPKHPNNIALESAVAFCRLRFGYAIESRVPAVA